ncbi:unnamed protein product [Brugia timori]|uniref:Uncharacterized protein n=1 Tax=Brugia timori TaxID=42155 RepID=A0A3P7X965_9BILA|nr:unnamed protein product [Brugia timori]
MDGWVVYCGGMKFYVIWLIIGLLTIVILSNLFVVYNIIKTFIFNQSKIKLVTVSTTTQKYVNSIRSGRIYDAIVDSPTTLKHRHRYKFNKKLGKYIRIKKPGLEQTSKQNLSLTNSTIDPASNFYVTNRTITDANNIGFSFVSDTSNIFTNETTKKPFISSIFDLRSSHTAITTSKISTKSSTTATTTATTTSTTTVSTTTTSTTTTTATTTTSTTTTTTIPPIIAGSTIPLRRISPPNRLHQQKQQQSKLTATKSQFSPLSSTPSSIFSLSLLSSTFEPLSSLPVKLRLPNTEKHVDLSKKSQKFLGISTEIQAKLQTEELQQPSSSTKIIAHPRFTVLQTTLKLHQEQARSQDILNHLKSVESLEYTTKTSLKVTESDFTLVTALLDIGRGDWWEYRRPLESYYGFLQNLLKLKVNLVIFVDQKSIKHVYTQRKLYHLEHITEVIPITLAELPLYRYMKTAMQIISDERNDKRWDQQWDRSMSSHPEAKSAKYDILVNSKSYFLYNASINNPFKSEFFAWLDAGYAHGNQSIFPPSFYWHPTLIRGKISLIKVTPWYDNISRYTLADLYRKNWAVVSGGFLGGDIYSLSRFHQLYHQMVVDLINRKYVDDDQTTLVLLIQQHPSLFNVVHGDWFDAFYLFP